MMAVGEMITGMNLDQRFADVNKYIFIKQYERAFSMLEDLLTEEEAQNNMLFHLRRIELGLKIKSKLWFIENYRCLLVERKISEECGHLCMAMTEMFGAGVTSQQSVEAFTKIISDFGESPGAYFGLAFSLESMGNFDRAIYNYKQSLKKDPSWYPSYFGLSQVFYQKDDHENGDRFFYLFEKFAPFNLYGNFETHKKLSEEFLSRHRYDEAEKAISLLRDWWVENKGDCPIEVQIYENLMLWNIYDFQGDMDKSMKIEHVINSEVKELLTSKKYEKTDHESLYFIARSFDDFSKYDTSIKFYQKILREADHQDDLIEKISAHLSEEGRREQAKYLFEDAYSYHPENHHIRFYRLLYQIELSGIDAKLFFDEKDHIKKRWESGEDDSIILKQYLNLISQFDNDPDLHESVADIYAMSGENDSALEHYEKMYKIDYSNSISLLKYISFCIDRTDFIPDVMLELIRSIDFDPMNHLKEYCNLTWRMAQCFAKKEGGLEDAVRSLGLIRIFDPWNIQYIASEVLWKIKLRYHQDIFSPDPLIFSVLRSEGVSDGWDEFRLRTKFFYERQDFDIVYYRCKLYFLYTGGDESSFHDLLNAACDYDANIARKDLIKLLNTNFDHPQIYFGIGRLSQELWQMEVAAMWFEQALTIPDIQSTLKFCAYIELAECYIWNETNLQKGIEYLGMIPEEFFQTCIRHYRERYYTVLLHGYIKSGQINHAKILLEKNYEHYGSFEATYLKGLLCYRNNLIRQAKKIWKPLLTHKALDRKTHHIKQEMMRYYFENDISLKAN